MTNKSRNKCCFSLHYCHICVSFLLWCCHVAIWPPFTFPCTRARSTQLLSAKFLCFGFASTNHVARNHIDRNVYGPHWQSLCRPLVFNHFATNTQSFSHLLLLFIIIEFIKVCIHRLREIRATRNMKPRLAIKFPTPFEWWLNALPSGQEKASNARGMPGGMLKLRVDWYITSSREIRITQKFLLLELL